MALHIIQTTMARKIEFKVTPSRRVAISKLARAVGVSLNWNRIAKDSFQWDGKDIACKNQDASNILHDIAHWIVSTPERRKIEDFGLGPGPDSGNSDCLLVLTGMENNDEEIKASALGIWFEKQMGLSWESTADWHSWDSSTRARRERHGPFPELEAYWKDFLSKEIKQYEVLFRSRCKGSTSSAPGK